MSNPVLRGKENHMKSILFFIVTAERKLAFGVSFLLMLAAVSFSLPALAQAPQVALLPGIISTTAGTGVAGFSGDGGDATSAQLNFPYGIAVDGAGNQYVAEVGNHRVRKIDTSGVITTIAGTGVAGFSGDGGAATAAQLNTPTGVAVDAAGNIYIADMGNHRIRIIRTGGNVITTAAGTGTAGFSGDGGAATAAQLQFPFGVAVDGAGNLYIADTFNGRLRKVAAGSGTITTVAGNGTAEGYGGDGGKAIFAGLGLLKGAAADGAGNLYIAGFDTHRIRKVDAATGIISTVAGRGTAGSSGDGGLATTAELDIPAGIAVDKAGDLYIADMANAAIRKVDAANGVIHAVAGGGTNNPGDNLAATSAALDEPDGVAIDAAGNLFIADARTQRVRKITASAAPMSFVAVPAGSASGIQTVTVSNIGNAALTFSQIAASANFVVDGSTTCSTSVPLTPGANCVVGVRFSPTTSGTSSGTLTLTDNAGNVSGSTQQVLLQVQPLTPGLNWPALPDIVYGTPLGPEQLNATSTAFGTPVPGTFVYNPPAGTVLNPGLQTLTVKFTPNDTALFSPVSARNEIVIEQQVPDWNFSTAALGGSPGTATIVYTFQATATVGSVKVVTQGAPNLDFTLASGTTCTTQTFSAGSTCALAVRFSPLAPGPRMGAVEVRDNAGNVLFETLLRGIGQAPQVTITSGVISTAAGTGTAGFSGDGGAATSAQLNLPYAVAVDAVGNLYIADLNNARVRKVDAVTGVIATVAGNGAPGYSGDGGPATAAQLETPSSVAVDGAGNLYIADSSNSAIRRVDAATGIITTVAGTGVPGFSGDDGAATSAQLQFPFGVALDGIGNVFISDTFNQRIRVIDAVLGTIGTAVNGTNGPVRFFDARSVAVDSTGNLFVSDLGGAILKLDAVTATLGVFLDLPRQTFAVSLDGGGNVYAAGETGGSTITKVDVADGRQTVIAGGGNGVDGGPAVNASLDEPTGVAVDGSGAVFIADAFHNRIRKVTPTAATLAFPNVPVGSTTQTQSVLVSNSGTTALTFTNFAASNGFVVDTVQSTCSLSAPLKAGESCFVGVFFAPQIAGITSGTLTITDNAMNVSGATQQINLTVQ
jgi:sugar lactone lactonase YvrE